MEINLADLVEGLDEPQWAACPLEGLTGFEVRLQTPEAHERLALTARIYSGRKNGDLGPELTDGELAGVNLGRARLAVQDWRGLTVAGLTALLPPELARKLTVKLAGGEAADPGQRVAYDPRLRDWLLAKSVGFLSFVLGWLHRQELMEDAAEKNSAATPSTTPTPGPETAGGAGKKNKRSA